MDFDTKLNQCADIADCGPDVSEHAFRFAAKRGLLTYKGHLNKMEYEVWFAQDFGECNFLRLAHENGDKHHPYKHTHVLFETARKRLDIINCRAFDYDTGDDVVHPNIKKVVTVSHWLAAKRYLGKEDTENADLAAGPKAPLCQQIWDCESLQEALLRFVKKPTEMSGVTAIWRHKPIMQSEEDDPVKLRPWQQCVVDALDKGVDNRKIYWVYDKEGKAGKSVLALWLTRHRKALLLTQMGGQYHAGTIIQKALERGWDGKLCVLDFPRKSVCKDFYDPVECVKNGAITAVKYEGGTTQWTAGNVIVMANFLPKWGQWSEDRYCTLVVTQYQGEYGFERRFGYAAAYHGAAFGGNEESPSGPPAGSLTLGAPGDEFDDDDDERPRRAGV